MDRTAWWWIAAAAAAAGAWWYYSASGAVPQLSLTEAAIGESYSPFVFWMHHQMDYMPKNHPARICPVNFAAAVQNEDSGLSLRGLEIDCASAAQ